MDTLTFAGIGAGITAAWSWLRNVWGQFVSVFLVELTVEESLHRIVLQYCTEHFYVFPRKGRRIRSSTEFVRSLGSTRKVAYEITAYPPALLAKGFRLLWFGGGNTDRGGDVASIVFLRGTFDIDSIIAEAVNDHHKKTSTSVSCTRFRVVRHFSRIRTNVAVPRDAEMAAEDTTSHYQYRYIGFDREDIGAPTSTEPFEHLRYSDDVLRFRNHVSVWYQAQQWYRERKIPWRLSALFLGKPGNGKTSCARALGQEFDLPVHVIDVSGMSNEEFVNAYHRALAYAPAIVLLEDFDRVDFTQKDTPTQWLTMDCVLNCICGVESSDGILLLMTANDASALDPALLRPGRLDKHIVFESPTLDAKRVIAERILKDCAIDVEDIVREGANDTGAEFEFRCQDAALAAFWSDPKPGALPTVLGLGPIDFSAPTLKRHVR